MRHRDKTARRVKIGFILFHNLDENLKITIKNNGLAFVVVSFQCFCHKLVQAGKRVYFMHLLHGVEQVYFLVYLCKLQKNMANGKEFGNR
jgi:hypothetical protein